MFSLTLSAIRRKAFADLVSEAAKGLKDLDGIVALVILCYFAGRRNKRPVNSCLLVGLNGTSKTTVAGRVNAALIGPTLRALYSLLFWDSYQRVAGSPDATVADLVGGDVIGSGHQLIFKEGPLLHPAMIFYYDELNRSPPKTQSALLEPMAEGGQTTITTLDETQLGRRIRRLIDFFVIASQNPSSQEGTFPLPEALLDRFMVMITMPYTRRLAELAHEGEPQLIPPSRGECRERLQEALAPPVIKERLVQHGVADSLDAVLDCLSGPADGPGAAKRHALGRRLEAVLLEARREELRRLKSEVWDVEFSRPAADYIATLVYATWNRDSYAAAVGGSPEEAPIPVEEAIAVTEANASIAQGASPRAALALRDLSCALAWATSPDGAPSRVTAEHIEAVAPHVLRHRITLQFQAALNKMNADKVLRAILEHYRHAYRRQW